MKKSIISLIILCVGLLNCSCQKEKKDIKEEGMPIDFTEFYEKFHTDSVYQLEHISFPLDGIPALRMSKEFEPGFNYKKEDWKIHRAFPDSSIVSHSLELMTSNIVEEQIGLDHNGLMIFRRYSKIGDKWFLIYYMGPNFVKS